MELEPGTKLSDRLELIRPLGEGAMGSVWVAHHSMLRTEVAVKVIGEEVGRTRADAGDRFALEAATAAKIKSPHVVEIYDHGIAEDGTPYIVMELLSGESLADRLDRLGPINPELTADIISQVARGLAAAHARDVVHRDIKPQNVFLCEGDELFVKVLDFGIAKQLRLPSTEQLTEPGTIVGTPQYVSRDLIMSGKHKEIDHRVDMWSLAVVAYRCLTGKLPFDGDSIGQICAALAAGRFTPPSEARPSLGERFDDWFARALSEDPEARFDDVAELARTFRETAGRRQIFGRRARLGLAALVGGAILVVTGITMGRAQTDSKLPPPRVGLPTAGPRDTPATRPPATTPVATTTAPTTTATATSPPPVADLDWVEIPAGELHLGCFDDACLDDERPGKRVRISAFAIQPYEATVYDYAQCVSAGACSDRRVKGIVDQGRFAVSTRCNWQQPNREKHPMNCIDHRQARGYCDWLGGRLPTEAEWERAARGDDDRVFPWGDDEASCVYAVMAPEGDDGCGRGSTWAVGAKQRDRSPFGLFDMAGNVREWVSDAYVADAYASAADIDPRGPTEGDSFVARGGSWLNPATRWLRVSARNQHPESYRSAAVGVRCARDARP